MVGIEEKNTVSNECLFPEKKDRLKDTETQKVTEESLLKVICGTDYVTHSRTDFHVTCVSLIRSSLFIWDPYAFSRHAVVG